MRVAKRTDFAETYFVDGLYERVKDASGHEVHRYSIFAKGQRIAQVTRMKGASGITPPRTDYLLTDALGSVAATVVADEAGNAVSRQEFDPFGANRSSSLAEQGMRYGYTGHPHDEEVGLIDMRGRIYDPQLGRFLSVDPFLQAPFNLQSHNGYSYVWNNPLRYTDPTGFGLKDLVEGIGDFFSGGSDNSYSSGASKGASDVIAGQVVTGATGGSNTTVSDGGRTVTTVEWTGTPPQTPALPSSGANFGWGFAPGGSPAPNMSGAAYAATLPGAAKGAPIAFVASALPKSGIPGPNLVRGDFYGFYALSPSAKAALQQFLPSLNLNNIHLEFGETFGNSAFTLKNYVRLNAQVWNNATPKQQMELLAHELTHTVQYELLGVYNFLDRYFDEYPKYGVPQSLAQIPINQLNLIDPNWSLDQIADRIELEYHLRGP